MTEPSRRAAIISSPSQLLDCREYATSAGYTIVVELLEVGSDITLERPGIRVLLETAKEGKFDILILHSFNRLSTKSDLAAKVMATLEGYGVKCASVTENEALISMVTAIHEKVVELERDWRQKK